MPNGRLKASIKNQLLLNASGLIAELGIEISDEQQEAVNDAEMKRKKHLAYLIAWEKEHRELCTLYVKKYREANRQKLNRIARVRYANNRNKERARCKEYYYKTRKAARQANKEEINAYERARYQKNREKKIAACKAYRDAHREEINARRRAHEAEKKRNAITSS